MVVLLLLLVVVVVVVWGGGGGRGGGGVVTKFFGRTFLLHFCTNCEKTKLGKKLNIFL